MSNISGAKLAELTGLAWRTVKRRLDDAGVRPVAHERNAHLYESRQALRALYAAEFASDDGDDYDDQRQRLAAAQAEKVEHENAIRRGQLARREDVVTFWVECIAGARARLLRIPSECMTHVPAEHRAVVQDVVRRGVHSALEHLAEYEPEQ